VEYHDDLGSTGSWNTAVDDGSQVIISSFDDDYAAGVDRVEVKLHKDLAPDGKMFIRLSLNVADSL